MSKEQFQYNIRPTTERDIPSIQSFIDRVLDADPKAGLAIEPVSIETLQGWIEKGHSIIATLPHIGEIIGHQAVDKWPESGWYEVRTALGDPEYRGQGVNTELKKYVIKEILNNDPDAVISAFTHLESKSIGILTKLDFEVIPMDEVPEEFFSLCTQARCVKLTSVDCGCKILVLKKL